MVYSFFWWLLCGLAQQGLDFGFGQAEGLHLVQKLRRQRTGAPTAQGVQGSVIRCGAVRPAAALRLQKAAAFQLLARRAAWCWG